MNSNRNSKKGKRGFKKLITGVITAALAVVLCVTMIPQDALAATADLDTSKKYTESLGDNASTEYAGRIWTDKSVYSEDATFEMFAEEGQAHQTATVTLDANNGEDFLVAFSALATSQAVSGETQAPIDVVFVIDISGSMSNNESNMDNGYSRIYNTVQAVNTSITDLMALNEYTRVGVVAFSNEYQVLLPLSRYSKVDDNTNYFSLNKNTAAQYVGQGWDRELEDIYLYTNAKNSTGSIISKTTSVVGGTNIQMGLYGGLNMLATETSTSATIEGNQIKRIPSLILLSDGSPTYSSSSNNWWAPANNNSDGPGNSPYAGNGMKALMTGAYMKNAVDTHYGVVGTAYATSIYTIGMGITDLPNYESQGGQGGQNNQQYTGEQDLAYITLNPEDYWDESTTANNMVKTIVGAWDTYTTNNGTPSVQVNTTRNGGADNYTFTHPTSNDIDTNANALKELVTEYYAADSASSVTNVFDEIVSNIALSVPSVPTELGGDLPVTRDGYITYTDPIGEYMSVKDVKEIIYAGTEYTNKTKNTNGNVTTYVFEGYVDSAVYGQQEISDIIITVTKAADGKETLVVKVPASVIPVRVNTVQLKEDGTVENHTNNGAYPIRVVYSVGLQEVDPDGNGIYESILKNGVIDTSLLSDEYLANNTNSDGTVNFYSNLYSGNKIEHIHADDGSTQVTTVGDATVEFEPAHSNPFYYMQEDVPIYTDKEGKVQATGTLDDNTTYYYVMEYYHGLNVETEVVARTGKQLKLTDIITKDGKLYRAKGSPRLNRIMEFEGTKTKNATNTANDFYLPTFVGSTTGDDAYDGKYVIYLGNNGVVNYAASGTLEISKTVVIPNGLSGPNNQTFTFTVNFNGNANLAGTFDYDIVDANGDVVNTGTITDGGTLTLADAQKAVIHNLPHGTTYTVTETAVAGFATTSSVTDEGTVTATIEAGKTETIAFTNTYDATPVTVTSDMGLQGAKVLSGKDWSDTDSFRFILESRRLDTPMPVAVEGVSELRVIENSHRALIVTVADSAAVKDQVVDFGFGSISYDKEGTYEYVISELVDSNKIHGVSYSAAMYTVVVDVVDNGAGKLEATLTMTKVLDDAGATVNQVVGVLGTAEGPATTFTNVFDAENEVWIPAGTKVYTDNSGANPITTGMFQFKVEALTSGAPVPADAVVGNVDSQIGYEAITFTKDHAGVSENEAKTYVYRFTEVIPTGAVETSAGSNVWAYQGMLYDGRSYDVTVNVYLENGEVVVDAVYPAYPSGVNFPDTTPSRVVFANTYDPTPVAITIEGQKILTGRDWLGTDQFTFNLAGTNDAAKALLTANASVSTTDVAKVAEQTFEFGAFTIEQPGTYTFTVDEEGTGTVNGITYDAHVTDVTVVVTDTNGVLSADVTYDNKGVVADTDKAVFVNTYTTEGTEPISLIGTKNLTGRPIESGEFFFMVDPEGNAPRYAAIPVPGDNTIADGKYTSTAILLNNVVFTNPGTYTYYIGEQVPTGGVLNGVTYDQSLFKYTVTVEDVDKNGKLSVTSTVLEKKDASGNWVAATDVVFNNEYDAANATYAAPVVTKELTGREWKDSDRFGFKLELVAGETTGITLPAETTLDATKANAGRVEFGNITFTKEGEYQVKITEIIPDNANKIPGVTYSTNELLVTYKVTDNLDGNLVAQMIGRTGSYIFTNEYVATGTFDLTITKTLTGRDWLNDDEFSFEVVVLDPNTQTAIDNGDIVFPTVSGTDDIVTLKIEDDTPNHAVTSPRITINKAGTYKFVVRELAGTIAGVHYDSDPRTVTVVAVDNGYGTITATQTITKGTATVNGLDFTNIYDASSVELSGHDDLWVVKNFTGRPENAWYDDEFTFTLKPVDTNVLTPQGSETKPAVDLDKNNDQLVSELTLTVTKDNKAHAHFGNIVFNKAGTYVFEVEENVPSGAILVDGKHVYEGITYDPAKVKVIVTVDNDVTKGALVVSSVTYEKVTGSISTAASAIEFTNTYSVKETSCNVPITKTLVGRAWDVSDKFSFELSVADQATSDAVEAGIVKLPANTILVIQASGTVSDTYTGTYTIGFTKAGTYKFHIDEVVGSHDNITYDAHEAHVTITVTDDKAGNLVAAIPTSIEGLTFTNTYTPDPINVSLEGTKTLNGRTLGEHEFHFRIDAVTAGAPMPAHTSVPTTLVAGSDNVGKITFGPIVYTDADAGKSYTYKITEIHSNIAGITFDSSVKEVTVTVSKDSTTGVLSATTNVNSTSKFDFINTYTTTPTDPVAITATKVVTPSEGNSFTLQGGEFQFEIIPANGNKASDPVKALTSKVVTNDANGNVVFADNLKYTEAGIYEYTVHEVRPSVGATGMTYDNASYTITVTVNDDENVAKLSASVVIKDNGGNVVDTITFDNSYDPEKTSVTFSGKKELLGGHKDLAANEFEFELKAVTENAPMPTTTIVANDVTGFFGFDAIEYAHTGVFEYTISEVKGSETGMTYDATVYPITVTVTDENGQLKATVNGLLNEDDTAKVVFSNKYVPNPAYLDISGTKTLEGRTQNAEEFEFSLLDSASNVIATAKNTAQGTFVFKNVEFQKADTYYYTVVEKDTKVSGVTYDLAKVYGVKVVVEDNAGQLKIADVEYTLNGEEANITFNNSYAAVNPATIQLGAAKTLTGRELKAGEFTFLLTGNDGTALTATNGADGSVLFDEIKFTKAGTYTYVITEAKGNAENVTYDGSKYTVTVVVTDDLKGNFVAEITSITESVAGKEIAANAVTFENAYTAPVPEGTSPKTNDIFNIWMLLAVIAVAGFGFFGATAYSRRS